MADPLGKLLTGFLGFAIGSHQQRQREDIARLNDQRAQSVVNRTYLKLYAKLAQAKVGQFRLRDVLGDVELAKFADEIAQYVGRQLKEQP